MSAPIAILLLLYMQLNPRLCPESNPSLWEAQLFMRERSIVSNVLSKGTL